MNSRKPPCSSYTATATAATAAATATTTAATATTVVTTAAATANWLPLHDEINIQKCCVVYKRVVGESTGYME